MAGETGLSGVEQARKKMLNRTDALMRAFLLETVGRLVEKTPVDTGRAKGNWQIDTKPVEPGGDPNAFDKYGTEALAKALSWDDVKEIVYVTNGLPYIKALEDGHSEQAPEGMVKVTVEELKALGRTIGVRVRQNQTLHR